MASPPTFDLESLLQPISDDSPSGVDIRADPSPTSAYYEVKDVRSAARADERQGLFDGVIGSAEADRWRPILDMAPAILAGKAKDLEIIAFLIEALARTHGYAGMRDGFRLARECVERFWDDLHPMPDEYGIETRVSPLAGLNGSGGSGVLLGPIARIPITQGADEGPFAKWNVDQATDLERLEPAKQAERIATGSTSMEQVNKAVSQSDAAFFGDLVDDINGAIEEWKALGAALDERAGSDSPPSSQIRGALDEVLSRVRHVAKDKIPAPPSGESSDDSSEGASEGGADGAPQAAAAPGAVAGREQALQQLGTIADFFRKTEPHSPLAYLLERAVRWGHTPLPELLSELIPDQAARNTFNALTGVNPPEGPSQA